MIAVRRSTIRLTYRHRNDTFGKALLERGVKSGEALLQVVLFVVLNEFLQ